MQPDDAAPAVDVAQLFRELEEQIADLMPVAADMIATTMVTGEPSLDDYDAMLTLAEEQPSQLLLAILRTAAGLAHVAEMTPEQMRALNDPPSATGLGTDVKPTDGEANPAPGGDGEDLDQLLLNLGLPTTEETAQVQP